MAHPMVPVKQSRRQRDMSPVHPNAAAIDIGARMHVAAVGPDRDPEPVRTFNTFTDDLHRLADWFEQCGVKTVVMESTGVYWIPIYEILEQRGFAVSLVNARDARHVPGRNHIPNPRNAGGKVRGGSKNVTREVNALWRTKRSAPSRAKNTSVERTATGGRIS